MGQIVKKLRRDIIALLWLATGIFVTLLLATYNPADPSFNSSSTNGAAKNFCGYFGSFTADLLYQILGISSWALVLVCAVKFYRGLIAQGAPRKTNNSWSIGLFLIAAASLSTLHLPAVRFFQGHVTFGGWIGGVLSKGLVSAFNFYGSAIILWTSFIVLALFATDTEVEDWWYSLKERWPENLNLAGFIGWIKTGVTSAITETVKKRKSQPKPEVAKPKITKPEISRASMIEKFEMAAAKIQEPEAEPVDEEIEEPVIEALGSGPQVQKTAFMELRPKIKAPKTQRRVDNWVMPKLSLLEDPPHERIRVDEKEVRNKSVLLVEKLAQFDVQAQVMGIKPGPAVTMFEVKPAADVKISRITELADDLSLALSSESVRIIAPIPGRDVVGIETSNSVRETVYLKEILADEQFWSEGMALPVGLGQQADGKTKIVDLRKMPHLLVAGSTGSGKSVFTVSLITSLLFRHSPKTLKLILIDPKQVDLTVFNDIPHLLMPPVREPKKAINALKWAIREMDKRYRSMSKFAARGLESYNQNIEKLTPEQIESHAKANEYLSNTAPTEGYYYEQLPYVVIVVEEFGDLMAVDKINVEQAVVRLAQMARACGIHLVLAMQSPRKDVVTGLIKTNIPGRISFKVSSKLDSRIILDEGGAERLLSRGDMLFLAPGVSKPQRHHGPWLSDQEIAEVTQFWRDQGEPQYNEQAVQSLEPVMPGAEYSGGDVDLSGGGEDEMYPEILNYVKSQKEISASLLQRRFRLGYPRAARLIELMEASGIVGPSSGSKPRQVLKFNAPDTGPNT